MHTSGLIELLGKMARDYEHCVEGQALPATLSYVVADVCEDPKVELSSRTAAWKALSQPLIKQAFDTSRFNQDKERNPRSNLQTWVRTDPYVNEETQQKINILGRLVAPLDELKIAYSSQPEWHESYTRVLHDKITQALRIKHASVDISASELAYVEQLMYLRYRLSMEDIAISDSTFLKNAIISKDESLLKRGKFIQQQPLKTESQFSLSKDGNVSSHEAIVNAIFGSNFRQAGEKKVTRTITISITDHVD